MAGMTNAARPVAAVVGVTALLSVLLLAFTLPSVHSGPHGVRVGIVADRGVAEQIAGGLDAQDPGALQPEFPTSEQDARAAIAQRRIDGAVIVGRDRVVTLVTTAGSPSLATVVEGIGTSLAHARGLPAATVDVQAFGHRDPRGIGLSAGALPLALGGWIGALVIMMVARRSHAIAAAALGFSVVGGLALTAVLRFVVGTFDDAFWPVALTAMFSLCATTFAVIGLRMAGGLAGTAVAGVALVVLGNPLSGLTSSPRLLPEPWGTIGQLLPPGAMGSAMRSVAFFGGHGSGAAFAVLGVWLVGGVGLFLRAVTRGKSTDDAFERELDDAVGYDEGLSPVVSPPEAGPTAPRRTPHRHAIPA